MRGADDYLQRAATHEAGHCVAALTFGIPIVEATVEGSPHLRRGRFHMQRSTGIECLAILCLSGPAAEEMVCGPICDGGDRGDLEMARTYLRSRFSELEVAQQMQRMRDAANRLVRTRWAEVRIWAIAGALVERGTLTADEIYTLTSL